MTTNFRTESDSMGNLQVPKQALWGAQTQRAVENFPISGLKLPRDMIRALGLIKASAARVNQALGLLDDARAVAIIEHANAVAAGEHDAHFPVDIFQTGSGTSSNMNCNEVIAHLASASLGQPVHPNDHINMGQSSNDVFPTAIHVAASLAVEQVLAPALQHLIDVLDERAAELRETVTTGRTHLMDAMPVTLGQEIGGWAAQLRANGERLQDSLKRMRQLTLGGTAVGTGINAHPEFGSRVAEDLARETGVPFVTMANYFVGLSSQDSSVELSGQLKTLAVSLMKIVNDLRWMNAGPLAGLAEIALPALQPGSSIMPGKVNPVIPEAVTMVCAQVIGNDATIAVAGQSGNFQLNVMLPVIAHNLLQSIELLGNAMTVLANKSVRGFTVNHEQIDKALARNPILVTALNSVIGYEQGARIAKQAWAEGRAVIDVAAELTDLSEERLRELLDPLSLTRGAIHE